MKDRIHAQISKAESYRRYSRRRIDRLHLLLVTLVVWGYSEPAPVNVEIVETQPVNLTIYRFKIKSMLYIIKELHIQYQENKITELAVLWQSNERGWARASYCKTTHYGGYGDLMPDDVLSPELIQKVAGYGMNLPDEKKQIYFPGEKPCER